MLDTINQDKTLDSSQDRSMIKHNLITNSNENIINENIFNKKNSKINNITNNNSSISNKVSPVKQIYPTRTVFPVLTGNIDKRIINLGD